VNLDGGLLLRSDQSIALEDKLMKEIVVFRRQLKTLDWFPVERNGYDAAHLGGPKLSTEQQRAQRHDCCLRGAPVSRGILGRSDEVEGLAYGLGGLTPPEQRLHSQARGFNGSALAGRVDAGLLSAP